MVSCGAAHRRCSERGPVSASTVSVVMGTYNGASEVERSVRSLLAQTLTPKEIVVVDDGSTDDTPAVLRRLALDEPTVTVVSMPKNRGNIAALNLGISVATGDYVAIADDDDVSVPHRLETSLRLIEERDADMVGGQVVGVWRWPLRFATSRFPTDPAGTAERIAGGFDPLPHITMMVRRDRFERFGAYRPNPRGGDMELMLRWARQGARIVVSPEVLATYTFRGEFFDPEVQTRWMVLTNYAREVALIDDDDDVPPFDQWFTRHRIGPARREARKRVVRLAGRLAVGTLFRRR